MRIAQDTWQQCQCTEHALLAPSCVFMQADRSWMLCNICQLSFHVQPKQPTML